MRRIEKNILIIGAGRAGKLLAQDILANYHSYHVVGFVDDHPDQDDEMVLGKVKDCQRIANRLSIDEMIIAIPSADGALVRSILLANLGNRIPIRIVPRNQRIISESDVRYEEVKDLGPEDFLGRPFTNANVGRLKQFYAKKTALVTGGAGSIGSEIVRQLLDLDIKHVIVYDNSEYLVFLLEQQLRERGVRDRVQLVIGNIRHEQKLDELVSSARPDVIFHAAAYKHVHLMEENIDEAVSNNVIGTKRVVDIAVAHRIPRLTFISTDKVVNPKSIMGATKKLGEHYLHTIQGSAPACNIVRFGNVINSNGSVLPLFERQMALHSYVTVTHRKMERFFMSIREAAQLVIESTALGEHDAIHVLNMGELIKVYDVARCLIRSKNLLPGDDVEVRITGLRKGEKLIEELYTATEEKALIMTEDSRMYILRRDEECPFDIHGALSTLERLSEHGGNQAELRAELERLFPSLALSTTTLPLPAPTLTATS